MIIVLNNKSNFTKQEFLQYQESIKSISSNSTLILCPSTIYLTEFNLNNFLLGSQNVSSYKMGAYTGEASAKQLKSIGVKYSIVGHSERRNYLSETNQDINKKIKLLLSVGIIPILCIGETIDDKEKNITNQVLETELKECLKDIDGASKVIIAYEPIWSIGTGNVPNIDVINNIFVYIKNIYPENKIIYGGSVNKDNINNLKSNKIDGYLLGGLSLQPNELEQFLKKLK